MSDPIRLELSKEEALVLFEWLSTADEREPIAFAHHAEEVVLWGILGQLEKQLVEPFRANYVELVAVARAKVESEH